MENETANHVSIPLVEKIQILNEEHPVTEWQPVDDSVLTCTVFSSGQNRQAGVGSHSEFFTEWI